MTALLSESPAIVSRGPGAGARSRYRGLHGRRVGEPGFRYSRWDGTQTGFDLDAEALLDEMTDDLLYHGDLNAALRRLMQQGFQDRNGERAHGPARDAPEAARAPPREARALRPRRRLRRHRRAAPRGRRHGARGHRAPGRRGDAARATSAARRSSKTSPSSGAEQLEQLPPDLAGKVQALQQYELMDDAARQRFEELMDQLREQLMQSYFNQMSEGMQNMTPERMAADEGHARRAQPDARAARARRGARLRRASWSATATSSPATRRPSTSCSSRWRSRWRRCSSSSTR